MHDWRNFNNVSFESIMVILYDKSMTTVIHPGTWSLGFSGTHCIGGVESEREVKCFLFIDI